jgi:peptidoglycan/xylan/chitin deacetylase (PgdA/CDA1 family)
VSGQLCVRALSGHSRKLRLAYAKVSASVAGPEQVVSGNVEVRTGSSLTSGSSLTADFLPAAIDQVYRPIRWQVISEVRSAVCAHPLAGGRCAALFPAKPTLLRLHTPVLLGCVASGPSLVYSGSPSRREIALTFDDGPWTDPPTAQFLAVLEREHVPATFFEIGRQVPSYDPTGALERRMLADGDMIGDHTWSHLDLAKLRARQQRAQLLDAAAAIKRATRGFTPCLWRPPYGDITPSLVSLARSLGFLTIMWDVDPRDWALPGVGAIYSNVVGHAHNGAIVVQHVGGGPRFQTLAALPREIEALKGRGYQFVTVAQLLGLQLLYR